MVMRLRYIGGASNLFIKDKVYYANFKQADDLSILIRVGLKSATYNNLEDFLDDFKILSKDRKVANARIHNQ